MKATAEHVTEGQQNARRLVAEIRAAEERSRALEAEEPGTGNLRWIDGRWHVNDGRERVPIHAGDVWQLRPVSVGGSWITVRIESQDHGRRLIAYVDVHGLAFRRELDPKHTWLRKPPRH